MSDVTRTLWLLTPVELRGLANECEKRGGFYVQLLDADPGMWVAARLDDESGGEEFTIDTEGRSIPEAARA